MDKCPDRGCWEGLKKCIHDETDKMWGEMTTKATKKGFNLLVTCLLSLLAIGVGGPLLYGMAADVKAKEKVQSIEMKQAVVIDSLGRAIGTQGELQKNQQNIMLNVQKIQDDIEHESERSRKVDDAILRKLNEIQNKQ